MAGVLIGVAVSTLADMLHDVEAEMFAAEDMDVLINLIAQKNA